MTDPSQLRPSVLEKGARLRPWSGPVENLKVLHDRIAGPYRWPSLAWSTTDWAQRTQNPGIAHWAVLAEDLTAGLVELERQADDAVEITIFGLLPAFRGAGLGGAALTETVQAAWTFPPDSSHHGAPAVKRVWLHTSTRDGEHALSNYQHRGFTAFKIQTALEEVTDA